MSKIYFLSIRYIRNSKFPTLYRWLEYDYEKPAGRSPGSIPLGSGLPVS